MASYSSTPSTTLPTLKSVTIQGVKLDPLDLNDEKVRDVITQMSHSVGIHDSKTNDMLEELRKYLWFSQSEKVMKQPIWTRDFGPSGNNTLSGYLNHALSQHFSEMTGAQGPQDGITQSLGVFIRQTPLIEPYRSVLSTTASYTPITHPGRRVLPPLHETPVMRLSEVNSLKYGESYLDPVDPNKAYDTATRETVFLMSFAKQVAQALGVQSPIDSNPPPPVIASYSSRHYRECPELDPPTRSAEDQLKDMLALQKRYEVEAGFLFSLGDAITAAEGLPPAYDYTEIRHGPSNQHGPVIGQIEYAAHELVFLNWGHTAQVAKRIQRTLDASKDDSDA